MLRTRTLGSLVVAATVVVTPLVLPAPVQAHGHHGGVYVGVGGFYGWGWGPYWGWPYGGWGPWPYYYGAPGGGTLGYAMMSGLGGLDLSVKPKDAEVWVDGKYFAEARDLDGDPSYLWLKEGPHRVVLYKAGYRSFDEDVAVNVGMIRELKVTLVPGESQPPVPAAPEARPEPPRPEGPPRAEAAEPRAEATPPRAEVTPPQGEPRGAVHLRVRPEDATVYVDGEYRGTARALENFQLSPGHHRVELVRPGYQPLGTEFDVAAGQTTDIALSMEKQGGWKY
jgi:hypothetical protein